MPLVEKIIRTTRNTPQTKSYRKEVESLTQVNKHDNAVYLKRQSKHNKREILRDQMIDNS
jgi:hypothetical protein